MKFVNLKLWHYLNYINKAEEEILKNHKAVSVLE